MFRHGCCAAASRVAEFPCLSTLETLSHSADKYQASHRCHNQAAPPRSQASLESSFSAGFCWANAEFRRRVAQMACTAVAREKHVGWRDREDGIRPRLSLVTHKASSHKVSE